MEQIYTIPINEHFDRSRADASCGCPVCSLYRMLEENELDLILGASMMEPDVRIQTNEEGFCRQHYDMMFVRKNRLGMALTLESHLKELQKDIKEGGLGAPGTRPVKRIGALEGGCYVCRRISFNFEHMVETAVYLWDSDEDFPQKLDAQPYFCLPHYKRLLEYGQKRLSKKKQQAFADAVGKVVNTNSRWIQSMLPEMAAVNGNRWFFPSLTMTTAPPFMSVGWTFSVLTK